ncbi:MAG: alpha/beta fold hydrolase [Candidatus Margulisbacteria bacterium]|nr:alpha/beta fold hydrolase [Candidatus Margulisiibacteriota bacterium]
MFSIKSKRPFRQKILLILALILPLIFTTTLLTTVHLIRVIWINLLFHPILILRRKTRKNPENYGMIYEKVVFNTKDGLHLVGWLIPAPKKSNKTIILCHGILNAKDFFLPEAKLLHEAGFNVIAYDLRAHGESEGNFVTFGCQEKYDLEAILDYLKKNQSSWLKNVGILAHSLGAATAILAASIRKEIKSLIVINCFANIEDDITYWVTKLGHLPYWPFVPIALKSFRKELKVNLKEISPISFITKLKIPVFFMVSEKDEVTNPNDSKMLYEKKPGTKEIWIIPKAKHETFHKVAGKEYEKKLLEYFMKHLR